MERKDILSIFILLGIIYLIVKFMENRTKLAGVSNKEEWEIVRDSEGKLQKIIVYRDVKQRIDLWPK